MVWTEAAQNNFEGVKKLVVAILALALYDPTLCSVVSTNSSNYGMAAMFTRIQNDGTEKLVAFIFYNNRVQVRNS